MKISIDFKDLERETQRSMRIKSIAKTRAKTRIKWGAETIRRRVAEQMPIDTGAAVYRWGNPVSGAGIWREEDDGLTITQGANRNPFEYISRLNEGYSRQAPAGFIDAIAEEVGAELGDILSDEVSGAVAE